MNFAVDAGEDYREYTRSNPGHPFTRNIFGNLTVILILAVALVCLPLFWPLSATLICGVLLTLPYMDFSPEQDSVLRLDKSQSLLTVTQKRPGKPDKVTHRVSLNRILGVATSSHITERSRGADRGSRTCYIYGPVFLYEDGTVISTLGFEYGKEVKGLSNQLAGCLDAVNREVEEIARFLGVESVSVNEGQTVRAVSVVKNGVKAYEFRPTSTRLGSRLNLLSYRVYFHVISTMLLFGLFGTIDMKLNHETKKEAIARLQTENSVQPPQAPVDNSPSGIIRRGRYSEVLELTQSKDFDLNATLDGKLTPLQLVCTEDLNPETAWLLLRRGANLESKDGDGKTPGDYLLELYLEKDGQIGENQCLTLALLVEHGYKVPLKTNELGMTPIHLFARDSKMDSTVEAMVEVQGADINTPDSYGWTPLHHAMEARSKDLKLAFIRLVKLGAKPSLKSTKDSGPALQRKESKPFQKFKIPAKSTALELVQRSTSPEKDLVIQRFKATL